MKKFSLFLLLFAGLALTGSTQAKSPVPNSPCAAARSGRFQLFFSPLARADVYLVDTETGKIWHPVTYTKLPESPEVWTYQDRIDNLSERFTWEMAHIAKTEPEGAK